MNELHGIFAKNEVFIIPEVMEYSTHDRASVKGANLIFTHVRIRFTFYAPDGSSVSSQVVGEAMDTADKGMNKAMSIALKYCLLQMFLIPTEEQKDPDAFSYDESTPVTAPKSEPKTELQQALEEASKCATTKQLEESWNKHPRLHNVSEYSKAVIAYKNNLINNQ